MAQGFQALKDIIHTKHLTDAFMLGSGAMNRLLKRGIMADADRGADAFLNGIALSGGQVNSKFTIKIASYPKVERQKPEVGSGVEATETAMQYSTQEVVPYVTVDFHSYSALEMYLEPIGGSPEAHIARIRTVIGESLADSINDTIGKTLNNLSNIPEITAGDPATEFSADLIEEARWKGGKTNEVIQALFMSPNTLRDIQKKQRNGTIKEVLIKEPITLQADVVSGGLTPKITDTASYVYLGSVPVYTEDSIKDGLISIVEKGAFLWRNKPVPIETYESPKADKGAGSRGIKTTMICVIAPRGFSVLSNAVYHKMGPTYAQLDSDSPIFEALPDKRLRKIVNVKVKIGA